MMRRRFCVQGSILGAFLLLAIGCGIGGTQSGGEPDRSGYSSSDFLNMIVERNVAIPMRDGVVLRADIYRPAADGSFPTLVYRTPYRKDGIIEGGHEPTVSRAPRLGYALVVQEVRGRYNSDGEFRPYHQEGRDGYDTIEWAAAQSWSNGRVGTFGLSYPGAVQWLAAMEAPPHLVSIFPAMTFASGRHFFYHGGAFNHDWIRWIAVNIAPDVRVRRGMEGARSHAEARKEWEVHRWEWERFLPLRDFPLLEGIAPWYYDWLAHPDDGPYWSFADVVSAHPGMNVAALNFSGWYDSNYGPLGAIANFTGMRERAATPEARRGQRLILGPWDHGDPQEYETGLGPIDFGPNATFDYYGLVFRWHDRWLKGIPNGVDESSPVRLFVMGENVWRDEEGWPLERARPVPYYLHSGGSANSLSGDGLLSLVEPAGEEPPDRYLYDPADPVVIESFESGGPFDQAAVERRRDVLVYTTPPLEKDLEVTGPLTMHLFVTSSAVDTDFGVMLCDVHPDGVSYNLLPLEAGYLRARYRNSEAGPEPLIPDEPVELIIGGMVTSNLFRAGHRIRVQVSSSRFPVFDRNPNTGDPFGTSTRVVTARQTVLHDSGHPSRIILPVVPR